MHAFESIHNGDLRTQWDKGLKGVESFKFFSKKGFKEIEKKSSLHVDDRSGDSMFVGPTLVAFSTPSAVSGMISPRAFIDIRYQWVSDDGKIISSVNTDCTLYDEEYTSYIKGKVRGESIAGSGCRVEDITDSTTPNSLRRYKFIMIGQSKLNGMLPASLVNMETSKAFCKIAQGVTKYM